MKSAHGLDGLQRQGTEHRSPGRSQRAVQDLAEIFFDIVAKLFNWLVCCRRPRAFANSFLAAGVTEGALQVGDRCVQVVEVEICDHGWSHLG